MRHFVMSIVIVASMLSACGGGGGGSGSGDSANPPPSAGVGGDFTLTSNTVAFSGRAGQAPPAPQSLTLHLLDRKATAVGAAYVAPQTKPSWLEVAITGTAPDYNVTLTATTAGMAIGAFSATVTLGTADASGNVLKSRDVNVSLVVTPAAITVSPAGILIGGMDGTQSGPSSLTFSLATPTPVGWSAAVSTASGGSWLQLGVSSGQVGSGGITITVDADRALVPPGRYTGTITLQAVVSGQTLTQDVPVIFNKEAQHLHLSALGTAFSSFPSRNVLTRDLDVTSTFGRTDIPWTATSDQPWLAVTPSGVTGEKLTLTADPSGLQNDHSHVATVTVASADPSLDGKEQKIRVGFWLNATTDPPVSTLLNTAIGPIVANPVEPYVYVHSRGNAISVFNVYTAALVTTLNTGLATAGSMVISDDGSELYVMDTTTSEVVALNPQTGTERRRYPYTTQSAKGLAYSRPDSHPVIVVANGYVFDAATGAKFNSVLPDIYPTANERLVAHPSGRYVYSATRAGTPSRLKKYTVRYSALVTDHLTISTLAQAAFSSDVRDLCVTADGTRIFAASYVGGYAFKLIDALSLADVLTLPANPYPSNAECGWNESYLGGTGGELWAYRTDGSAIGSNPASIGFAVGLDGFVLSGDSTRYVALGIQGNDTKVLFSNAPTP